MQKRDIATHTYTHTHTHYTPVLTMTLTKKPTTKPIITQTNETQALQSRVTVTDAKRKRESRTQGYHRPLLAKSAQAQAVKIPPLSVSSLPPSLLRPNYPPLPNTAAKPEKSTREKYITHVTCCSSGPQSDVFHAFEQREIIVFSPSLYLRLALQRQVLPTELIFCALQPCV